MTEPRGGNFRDLLVWQKSITLVKESYRIARELPSYEVYGLASQLRRASVSIPSNIAEGNRRIHREEYIHPFRLLADPSRSLKLTWRLPADAVIHSSERGRRRSRTHRSCEPHAYSPYRKPGKLNTLFPPPASRFPPPASPTPPNTGSAPRHTHLFSDPARTASFFWYTR